MPLIRTLIYKYLLIFRLKLIAETPVFCWSGAYAAAAKKGYG